MPILRNTNTLVADNGGGKKTTTTYKPYGSQYGGASAGNTGSNLGLYGSNYGGASTKPATTTSRTTTSNTTASNGRTSGSTGTVANSAINAGKTVINNAKNIANQYAGSGGSSGGYSGSSGGSSASSGSGGSGGGGGSSSTNDDYLNKIIGYLEEQKRASDAYYKQMLENAISSNEQVSRDDQDRINLNYLRADRFLKNRYGDAITGTGLSNRSRNDLNWNKQTAINRQNLANNNSLARADYNRNLANSASTLAQGWYNYVLPVYTARQQNTDYLNYLSSMM